VVTAKGAFLFTKKKKKKRARGAPGKKLKTKREKERDSSREKREGEWVNSRGKKGKKPTDTPVQKKKTLVGGRFCLLRERWLKRSGRRGHTGKKKRLNDAIDFKKKKNTRKAPPRICCRKKKNRQREKKSRSPLLKQRGNTH